MPRILYEDGTIEDYSNPSLDNGQIRRLNEKMIEASDISQDMKEKLILNLPCGTLFKSVDDLQPLLSKMTV